MIIGRIAPGVGDNKFCEAAGKLAVALTGILRAKLEVLVVLAMSGL